MRSLYTMLSCLNKYINKQKIKLINKIHGKLVDLSGKINQLCFSTFLSIYVLLLLTSPPKPTPHFLSCTFAGVNIGGAGSYVYDTPANNNVSPTSVDSASKAEEKRAHAPKAPSKGKQESVFMLQICGSFSW